MTLLLADGSDPNWAQLATLVIAALSFVGLGVGAAILKAGGFMRGADATAKAQEKMQMSFDESGVRMWRSISKLDVDIAVLTERHDNMRGEFDRRMDDFCERMDELKQERT